MLLKQSVSRLGTTRSSRPMLTVAAFVATPSLALAGSYFHGLGFLPNHATPEMLWSEARGISADGTVVCGFSRSDNAGTNNFEAFRWTEAGGMQPLGFNPGDPIRSSVANGISRDGTVVVGQGVSPPGLDGFRWVGGVMSSLGDLPGGQYLSYAYACSGDGSVVIGQGAGASGFPVWRWESGVMTSLGALPGAPFTLGNPGDITPDGSVIVGKSSAAVGFEAFRWEAGVMVGLGDLPGGDVNSEAYGVTPDGSVIVGRGSVGANELNAFRWEAGVMVPLGDLPGGSVSSIAYDVADDGDTIVGSGVNNTGETATIWTSASGLRGLKDVLTNDYGLNLVGWHLINARSVSADGRTIVGVGRNPDGAAEAWIAHIVPPCPGDIDDDGQVGIEDLSLMLAAYGESEGDPMFDPAADLNGDHVIDITDLSLLLSIYGTAC